MNVKLSKHYSLAHAKLKACRFFLTKLNYFINTQLNYFSYYVISTILSVNRILYYFRSSSKVHPSLFLVKIFIKNIF